MTATIRTFRAPGAREALEAIKAAMGPDAVILGSREVKGGFFRKNEVEVTAALPHAAADNRVAAYGAKPAERPQAPVSQTPPNRVELAPDLPDERVGKEPAWAQPPGLQPAKSFKDELAKLREEMTSLRKSVAHSGFPQLLTHRRFDALTRHLLNRGMEDTLAEDAVGQALERAKGPGAPALMNALREVLAERVLAGRAPWLKDRRRIIGLIGPTGAGKTTTLAKIAAHALKQQQTVAMITIDTFRIGASEQLGHYANIMKVPSFVARNRSELELAVTQCSRVDLVLIDTAGCSKAESLSQQAELVRSVAGAQLHLCASVAAGPRDLAAVVERHRHLGPERLILTKLDEAAAPAAFLSASFRLSRPILAITDGQRVPEYIHAPATPELVELLLGPASSGKELKGNL